MSSTTGREVAAGTLWMTKGETTKVRVRVAARCGTPDCTYQGQLNIYDESTLGIGSVNISEPSRVIALAHISEVSSLNSTHPTLAAGDSTSKHNSLMFPMSLDNNMYLSHESMWGFMLLLHTGEAVELFADTREQQQLWIKYLHLMSMFPFSPIPEEPRVNPIRNSYKNKLKVSNFDADSVWPVYILSEEVGSRIQALGVHIVCLQSTLSQQKPARMTIISPLDMEPIVIWEANRMRRTGSLGNLIFIEIGRRCEGGPGLIWMYATPEDSLSFRETVTRFLFNGDARSVGAKPNPNYHYDEVTTAVTATISRSPSTSPCSSGSSSFQLSFSAPAQTIKKEKATYDSVDISEYDYAYNSAPARTKSLPSNDAYGHINKPAANSLPLNDLPPPINLQTHPSRKQQQHRRSLSNPGSTKPSPLHEKFHPELSTGPLKNCHGGSNDSGVSGIAVSTSTLEEDFQEIDKSLNDILSDLSISPPPSKPNDSPETHNGLDDIINQLEEFAKSDDDNFKTPVTRSNSLPSGQQPQNQSRRTNSTSTCHPTHYLTHKKAKSNLGDNEYVLMKPIGGSQSTTQSKPPRQSYDFLELQLSPIKEASTSTSGDYENYPPPEEFAKATPTNYVTPYENVLSNVTDDDDDIYENTEPIPLKENKVGALITSTLSELDNLQAVLNKLST